MYEKKVVARYERLPQRHSQTLASMLNSKVRSLSSIIQIETSTKMYTPFLIGLN